MFANHINSRMVIFLYRAVYSLVMLVVVGMLFVFVPKNVSAGCAAGFTECWDGSCSDVPQDCPARPAPTNTPRPQATATPQPEPTNPPENNEECGGCDQWRGTGCEQVRTCRWPAGDGTCHGSQETRDRCENTPGGGTSAPIPSVATTPTPGPRGHVDVVNNSTCTVSGWACDTNRSSHSITVHFYHTVLNSNNFIGSTVASQERADLATATVACDGTTAHGFTYQLPFTYRDGTERQLLAYALGVNADGSASNNNPALGNTPITISCEKILPPPTDLSMTCNDGWKATFNWTNPTGTAGPVDNFIMRINLTNLWAQFTNTASSPRLEALARWFVNDGSDIYKIKYPLSGGEKKVQETMMMEGIIPFRHYFDWGVQSIVSADAATHAHNMQSIGTQGSFTCIPKYIPATGGATCADGEGYRTDACTQEHFKAEYKKQYGYGNLQGVAPSVNIVTGKNAYNAILTEGTKREIIDLLDFEAWRKLPKRIPTPTPTTTPPFTPHPDPTAPLGSPTATPSATLTATPSATLVPTNTPTAVPTNTPTPVVTPDISVADATVVGNLLTNNGGVTAECGYGRWCKWTRNNTSTAEIASWDKSLMLTTTTAGSQQYGSCWIQWLGTTGNPIVPDGKGYQLRAETSKLGNAKPFPNQNMFFQIEMRNNSNVIPGGIPIATNVNTQIPASYFTNVNSDFISLKFCTYGEGDVMDSVWLDKISIVKIN